MGDLVAGRVGILKTASIPGSDHLGLQTGPGQGLQAVKVGGETIFFKSDPSMKPSLWGIW